MRAMQKRSITSKPWKPRVSAASHKPTLHARMPNADLLSPHLPCIVKRSLSRIKQQCTAIDGSVADNAHAGPPPVAHPQMSRAARRRRPTLLMPRQESSHEKTLNQLHVCAPRALLYDATACSIAHSHKMTTKMRARHKRSVARSASEHVYA